MRLVLPVLGLGSLIACGGPAAPVATPSPPTPPAPLALEPGPRCPTPPPGAERIASLGWGDALYDVGYGVDIDEELALTPLFPDEAAAGRRVVAVTPVDVDGEGATELAALVLPAGADPDGFEVVRHDLALYRCGDGRFDPITTIEQFERATRMFVLAGQQVRVGDRAATSLRLIAGFPGMEMVVQEVVLDAAGVVGVTQVGEQVVVEGGMDHYRHDVIGGSGWFPAGDGRWWYLAIAYHEGPDAPEVDVLNPAVVASLDAGGVHHAREMQPVEEAWALLGRGERPAWCGGAPGRVRCAAIDTKRAARVLDGPLAYDWIAGVWPTAAAATAALAAAGAPPAAGDWLYLGEVVMPEEGESIADLEAQGYRVAPPPGPDGRPSIIYLQTR